MKAINLKVNPEKSAGDAAPSPADPEPYFPTLYLSALPEGTTLNIGQEVTLKGKVVSFGERENKKDGSKCNADIEVTEMTPCACKGKSKDARAEDEEAIDKGLDEVSGDDE